MICAPDPQIFGPPGRIFEAEVITLRWSPPGEWKPTLPGSPTPLSPTLRPRVRTWGPKVTAPVLDKAPLTRRQLRRSAHAWKELQAMVARPVATSGVRL